MLTSCILQKKINVFLQLFLKTTTLFYEFTSGIKRLRSVSTSRLMKVRTGVARRSIPITCTQVSLQIFLPVAGRGCTNVSCKQAEPPPRCHLRFNQCCGFSSGSSGIQCIGFGRPDPNPDPGGKITLKRLTKIDKSENISCSLLRAEGFCCSWEVLYGGQRINELQYDLLKL